MIVSLVLLTIIIATTLPVYGVGVTVGVLILAMPIMTHFMFLGSGYREESTARTN